MLKKATAVLIVEAIEPCLAFWTALELKTVNEVPGDDGRLGFVILGNPSFELMYQTAASVAKDAGAELAGSAGKTHLFVEVGSLEPVKAALAAAGAPIFLPERTTFYGSREIGYREPGGHFVTFAAFG